MADIAAIRLKLSRAEKHIDELDSKLRAINPNELYGFRREFDPQRDMYLYIGTHRGESLQGLAPIIGDPVQNMRAVLDYIIWELSLPKIREGGYEGTGVGFPLYEVPNDKRFRYCLRYISKDIKKEVMRIVGSFQPYEVRKRTSNPKSIPVLSILDDVSIEDKHHSLSVLPINVVLPKLGDIKADIIKISEDTTITIEVPASTNPQENFEPKLALRIGIEVPKIETSPREVDRFLRYTHDYIKDTVIPDFLPFFQ